MGSLLLDKVVSKTMPPSDAKLTGEEIGTFRLWIDEGAPTNAGELATAGSTVNRALTEHHILPIFQLHCIACHGKRCLIARRLVERGVRFVQLYIESQIWDSHSNFEKGLRYTCGKTIKPVVALLSDLKQHGLLNSTFIVWGDEFGRLPLSQNNVSAAASVRDHGPPGFSVWLAGGGVKDDTIYGTTDEFGHNAQENRTSIHDFPATILHLLGKDFCELAFEHHELTERLTDQFPARVVSEILA